jgi:sialidase-1
VSGRVNLAVRISYDEGETWSEGKVINPGKSMYSDLTICEDGTIGILYEPGDGVRFTSITLEDLTDGKDKLSKPYQVPGTEE